MSWPYAYTPYIWPMLGSACFMVGLAVYAWRHRTVPGAGAFAIQMLFSAFWALFAAIEMAASAEPTRVFWFKLERMTAPPTMAALLFFALEYASLGKQRSRRNALVLSALVLFATALMATDDLHHLFWIRLWFDGFVRFEGGPLNTAVVGYVLLLPTLALLIFLRLVLRSRGILRGQTLLLFTGNALPMTAFVVQRMGINPIAPLDPTILMLNLTGLLFTFAIYRFGMLGVIPVGRDTAMERMSEGLLILDAEGRIADLNLAAHAALTLSPRHTIGRPARQVLAVYPDLCRLSQGETAAEAEISVNAGGQSRYYQVHASPLVDPNGFKLGRLISLQDVTEQKRARDKLQQQQQVLATLQERERLALELHDTLVQATAAIRMQAETTDQLLTRGEVAQVHTNLERLADAAQEMHLDLREYIFGVSSGVRTDQDFFAAVRAYLSQFEQRWGIQSLLRVSAEVPRHGLGVVVETQLVRIIQEALTNVRKHARARHVEIAFECKDAKTLVTIQDDGCGFDLAQLAGPDACGFGTRSMRERAQAVGGTFAIESTPGQGTRVMVQIPGEK